MAFRWRPSLFGVLALLAATLLHAETSSTLGDGALLAGAAQTRLGDGMRLFGVPIDIRILDIPAPIAQAARELSKRHAGLSTIGVYPDRIMMSGQVADRHCIVDLMSVGPQHTRGSLSVWAANAPAKAASVPAAADDDHSMIAHGWLPKSARLRLQLEQAGHDKRGHTLQQIWTLPSSVSVTRRAVHRGLQEERWQLEAAASATDWWRRDGRALQITILEVDGGSGILLQQDDSSGAIP